MTLALHFTCTKEIFQNSLNQNSSRLREFVQAFGPQLTNAYFTVLCWFASESQAF